MPVFQFIHDLNHRLFGGYAELLRIPKTPRFAIGAVVASMPFPMIGMTITIAVQSQYGSYGLAGSLTAVQAIALALAGPQFGRLVDKFGQKQVAIPIVIVWTIAVIALTTAIQMHAPEWLLYCIVPFLACIPPWGAMARARWTHLLKGKPKHINTALSLSSVFDECMWVIGNPLASILAVISGILAFSFTGFCVILGALMFLSVTQYTPPSQTELAKKLGMTRAEYRAYEAKRAAELTNSAEATQAASHASTQSGKNKRSGKSVTSAASSTKGSLWSTGMIAICATVFSVGAFQSATGISVIAFAKEQDMQQFTGFVFACFSGSSLVGALFYGAKNWLSPLWKRFYFCLTVVNVGIGSFVFANNLWVIMVIYLIIGVCQAPTWINANQIMLHLVPPSRFTEGLAWTGAMNAIGSSCGSALAGQYIDRFGSHGGFVTVTVLALLSLAIAFTGFKNIKTSTETPVLNEVQV